MGKARVVKAGYPLRHVIIRNFVEIHDFADVGRDDWLFGLNLFRQSFTILEEVFFRGQKIYEIF